jgi:ribose transport system ATP-binding protein
MPAPASPEPLLVATGIQKSFAGVAALRGVDLVVRGGEVVALVGENGAGKSTLMKVLAGIHRPDAGRLSLAGAPLALRSPADALRAGIALIHQELSLCDNLTVVEGLYLGAELRRGPFLRRAAMRALAPRWLDAVGLQVALDATIATLSPGQRQLLEIARALRAEARLLILDEPTSSLTQVESARLLDVVRDLRHRGVGIVYITHRLGEVQAVADRIVGLRDGSNSGELPGPGATHAAIVGLLVGRRLGSAERTPHAPGAPALVVRGLRTVAFPAAAVDLTVHAGEVVGIAGLLGAGRSELLRALFGVDRRLAGAVEVAGCLVPGDGPRAAIARGLVLLPEDRKHQGVLLDFPVAWNLSLPTLADRGRRLDTRYEADLAARSIRDLGIATRGPLQRTGDLSGGNQQKVALGKWLAAGPKVLLLDEPTRGVDVGARAQIHALLHELAGQGLAVLFASSELEEVLTLADRTLVLRQGQVAGELSRARMSEASIMMLATTVEAR